MGGIFGSTAEAMERLELHARMLSAIVRVITEEANLDPDASKRFLKMLNVANELNHEWLSDVDLFPKDYLDKAAAGEFYEPDGDEEE